MKKQIFVTIILVLFLSFSTVNATKIQKNDTWTYEDENKIKYDEEAIEIVQLVLADTVSVVKVRTNRVFPFDMNFVYNKFVADITFNYEFIYLTQEGAIPYIGYDVSVTGTIVYNGITLNFSNVIGSWFHVGDPSIALVTTSSINYEMSYKFAFNVDGDEYAYFVWNEFVIYSNSNAKDIIKNFTITPNRQMHTFIKNQVILIDTTVDSLHLNSFEPTMLLTYEDGISQPVYIAQTAPITIEGLRLSQTSKMIEYFLLKDDPIIPTSVSTIEPTSEESSLSMIIIPSIILLVIFRKITSHQI